MEFPIILPSGQTLNLYLSSKELKGNFMLEKAFSSMNISGDAKLYFGLCYSEKGNGTKTWILPNDNLKSLAYLSSSSSKKGYPSMQLAMKVFPKSPELVLSTTQSRVLFRQIIKNMIVSDELGCDLNCHAILDSYIAQSELGDMSDDDKDYIKKLNKLNIFAPSLLVCSTPINETEYMKMVRSYHRKLNGERPAQAEIKFLNQVQKMPLYGFKIFTVLDKSNQNIHSIALSVQGIYMIYDSYIEQNILPKRMVMYPWEELVFSEMVRNKVHLGFLKNGTLLEFSFKIPGNYSNKVGSQFLTNLEFHKNIRMSNMDCANFCGTRKLARRVHTTKLPRRKATINRRFINTLRSSLKIRKKVHSNEQHDCPSLTINNNYDPWNDQIVIPAN